MGQCHCGSNKELSVCCLPYLTATRKPSTPESLMRSRYTAFCLNNMAYIQKTMLPPASTRFEDKSTPDTQPVLTWLKLKVLHSQEEGSTGYVEFEAYCREDGVIYKMHERSKFSYQSEIWYYVDAEFHSLTKLQLGRNDVCFCGSEKKFKKCCGR